MTNGNGDITARLNNLKSQIEQGKTEKTRAQTNLESYTKQRDEVVAEMQGIGVTPETVESEIQRLDQEIQANLAQAEELIKS